LGRAALHAGLAASWFGPGLGLLREAAGGALIVVPGVRPQGDPAGDQVRTIEPAEAVAARRDAPGGGSADHRRARSQSRYRRFRRALD